MQLLGLENMHTHRHTCAHHTYIIYSRLRDEIRDLDEGGRDVSGETLIDVTALG